MDNRTQAKTPNRVQQARDREQELVSQAVLYRLDPGMVALRKLLETRLQEAQQQLLRCQPDDFRSTQARARVLDDLLTEIFTSP